jgi:hypothetical protein
MRISKRTMKDFHKTNKIYARVYKMPDHGLVIGTYMLEWKRPKRIKDGKYLKKSPKY